MEAGLVPSVSLQLRAPPGSMNIPPVGKSAPISPITRRNVELKDPNHQAAPHSDA